MTLVMIERTPVQVRKIGQASIDESASTSHLIRIRQVQLRPVRQPGRTQREFPPPHQRRLDSQGEEKIRFADIVVIEKIRSVGPERIGIEHPSPPWNGDAELFFLVALSV